MTAVSCLQRASSVRAPGLLNLLPLISMVAVLIGAPMPAAAQSIMINDCQGFTRAVQRVEPGQTNNLNIDVVDAAGNPADGVNVSLTNTSTGTTTTVSSSKGVATFANLAPGSYTLASAAPGVVLGTVSFTTGALILGSSAPLVVGGVAAGGIAAGSAVAAVAIADATDGNPAEATPTPTPTPQPTATPAPTRTPPPACDICDPDATPKPLPDDNFDPPRLSPAS